MNDPLLSLAIGYLNGKISIGEVTLTELEAFCIAEGELQSDGIAYTTEDQETLRNLDLFASEVSDRFKKNSEGLSLNRMIEAVRQFGEKVAQGKASASNIAKLAGLSDQQLEGLYLEAIENHPKGQVH